MEGIGAGSMVRRKDDGSHECVTDEVAIEEPLEMRISGSAIATTMRTPGNDEELAAGFLLSEGIVRMRPDLRAIAPCTLPASLGNVINIELGPTAKFTPAATQRFGTISTSCGLCGKTSIEFIRQQLPPIDSSARVRIDEGTLLELPGRLRSAQGNFARTGGIHAAGIFDLSGKMVVVREDIGRHNAVDKVVGRMLLDGQLPATGLGLFVSGRASFELVQKAWAGGFSTLIAVSAPTALAVQTARRAGLTLAGFVRGERLNVYAPERMQP
jgi:FdhD protein